METKSYQRFRQRMEFADLYIQTIYASLTNSHRWLKHKSSFDEKLLISDCLKTRMIRLQVPLTETNRVFNYSKANICKYYIVEIYKAFDEYLHSTIKEIIKVSPNQVIGLLDRQINLTGIDIIQLGTYDKICNKISDDIYRGLENLQSTVKLLDKYCKTFKIVVDKDIISSALSVLELRHLIIHNNSKIDSTYEKNYSKLGLIAGNKIPTKYSFVSEQKKSVISLVKEIDRQNIENKLIKTSNEA